MGYKEVVHAHVVTAAHSLSYLIPIFTSKQVYPGNLSNLRRLGGQSQWRSGLTKKEEMVLRKRGWREANNPSKFIVANTHNEPRTGLKNRRRLSERKRNYDINMGS